MNGYVSRNPRICQSSQLAWANETPRASGLPAPQKFAIVNWRWIYEAVWKGL